MSTGTVQLHRILRASPDKVYRAFVEPDAFSRWLPPHGFCASLVRMDVRVGGGFQMSFRNFTTGHSHAFSGTYKELEAGRRLSYTTVFEAPGPAGELTTTVELWAVSCGTELRVLQEGIPAAIPAEQCNLGWQESLEYLARLVEPEIP
ncbi:MAG: SRPBCC family protein [Vulcanimicrobiota bacterium]